MKRIHPNPKDRQITCLTKAQLQSITGGDLCMIGYKAIDEDSDGTIDYLIPIYAPCGESNPSPAV